mgnify:CR=1 FL=1
MLTARSNFYSIVLLGFCMLVLQDTYAQRHPLSRVDSSMVITNLNKYQELMGQKDYRSAADAVNKVGPVADKFKTHLFHAGVHDLAAFLTRRIMLRVKYHSYTVLTLIGKVNAELPKLLFEEWVRYLYQDAGAISRFRVGTRSPSMLHIFKHSQRIPYGFMRFSTINIDDSAYPAIIFFKSGCIKAFVLGSAHRNLFYLKKAELRK